MFRRYYAHYFRRRLPSGRSNEEVLTRCSFKECLKTLSPIRVSSTDRVLLEDMVAKASLPTYVRNFLRSPSDVNRLSGSELELLAMAIVPVAAAEGLIPCKRRAAVLLQSVIIGSILQNCPMSRRLALVLQRSLNFCSRLFDESFGRDFAFFKKHLWFDHAADDIVYRGNPSEFSTSMFESEYRLMKRGIRLGNTRCPSGTAFILHLYRLVVAVEMEIRGERNEVESLPLVKSSMEDGTPHMRSQIQYRDEPSFNVLRQCGCNVFFLVDLHERWNGNEEMPIFSSPAQPSKNPDDSLMEKLIRMHKDKRMDRRMIMDAAQEGVEFDLPRLLDGVVAAKNPQDAHDRAQLLKAAISVERLKDQLKSAESAVSSLRKKRYAKTRAESAETSSDFGSLDPPEGDFKIAPSSIGPGGDLKELYIRLRVRSRPMAHTAGYMNFFSKFIGNVVTEMYDRSTWHRLTDYIDLDSDAIINFVRATYGHANKEVGESFYMDVFNMISVALTNFRRNLKNQGMSDHSTDQHTEKENANEVQMQDSLPPPKDNDVLSQEPSQASTALTFFDYYQP